MAGWNPGPDLARCVRVSLLTGPPTSPLAVPLTATAPRVLRQEVLLVLGVSLGASAVRAALDLAASLSETGSLASQTATLNASRAPGHPWIDLGLQLTSLGLALVPVLLALHLLSRSGDRAADIGLDRHHLGRDAAQGAALAAVVGGTGLAFYLVTHALGIDLTVQAESLPAVWWRYPVLLLAALHDGLLEEVIVVGYLMHRLRQIGWSPGRTLAASAFLRGSYHLYQGVGGFAGNLVMGVVFGRVFQRYGRVGPLIVAHTLIDAVAFCGYAALAGHVGWLPVPTL
ncbi:type II CAAX endopeptidase family protein [Acidothermaceae bacterium B102]|nr:type II CAAX endopeptidase family protein [Acidothermaceae bacterium B102]